MPFIKKHRVILTAAAVFAACLLVFAVFWQLDVRGAAEKSRGSYLNDLQEDVTAPAKKGIEQTFLCDVPFYKLGVLPSFKGEVLPGTLTLTVYDSAGNPLADPVTGKAPETVSGSYAVFSFPHALESADGVYRLVFEAAIKNPKDEFALVKSSQSLPGWTLVENGRPAEGSLCLLATVDVIGGFVNWFYLVFALCASVAMAGIALFSLRKGIRVHTLFVWCAVLLGLLYCFILPPYSAPNEEAHINRAFNLSSGLLGQGDGAAPGTVVRRASDNDVEVQENGTTIFTYRALVQRAFSRADDPTPTVFEGESAAGNPIFSLPATLGLALARLLGLGLVPSLFLGRLFALAAYVALAALAVKITPTRKGLLAVAGLLPLAVHMGASYNPTGLVLACAMLVLALCLRAAQKDILSLADVLLPGGVLLLVASAGLWYLPAALALMLLWGKTISVKGKTISRPACCSILAGVLVLCVAAGLGTYAIYGYQSLQMSSLLSVSQDTSTAQDLLKTLFGGLLGDFNLSLNWGFTLAVLVLLAFALLPEPQDGPLPKTTRGWLLAACLGGGVVLAFVSGFTAQAAALALPLLPALLCALSLNWGGITKQRDYTPFLLTAFSGLAVFSLLDAFLLILTR